MKDWRSDLSMSLLSESVLRVEQNVNHVEVIDAERKTFAALGAGRGNSLYQNMPGSALASAVGVKAVLDKTEGLDKLVACVRSLLKIESAPESA
jgi:hypothetical protein